MSAKLIFSGVQPTGSLHLGNYLGAIKNWVKMQDSGKCIFCIVDLHAITIPQNPETLRQSIRTTAAAYIACGINPDNNIIFNQSAISGHAELAWILGCLTPIGWLNRMTQFKEKSGKHKEKSGLGLYSYPVLMAADVLLYKTTHVPVGEDQKQHIELARDIAGAFNRAYENEYFPLPEPVIMAETARIMSLRDGRKKMSKSDESDNSRINLTDSADIIASKIKKATSDSIQGIFYDPENRPEAANLLSIYAALSDISVKVAAEKFANSGFAQFKAELADLCIAKIELISKEINRIVGDVGYLDKILKSGAEKAGDIASKTIAEVKQIVGFS